MTAQEISLGLALYWGPWLVVGVIFWAGVRWWVRQLDARDTMARFRPHRRAVAAAERKLGVVP